MEKPIYQAVDFPGNVWFEGFEFFPNTDEEFDKAFDEDYKLPDLNQRVGITDVIEKVHKDPIIKEFSKLLSKNKAPWQSQD